MPLPRQLVRLFRWATIGSVPTSPAQPFPAFIVEPLEERFVLSPLLPPWTPGQVEATAQVAAWSDSDVSSPTDTIALVSEGDKSDVELPQSWLAGPPLLEVPGTDVTAARLESADVFLPLPQPGTGGRVAPSIDPQGFIGVTTAIEQAPATVSENGASSPKAEPSLSVLRLPIQPNSLSSSAQPGFQIQRTPVGNTALTVPYTVRSFGRGEPTSASRMAVLAGGSAKVDVLLASPAGPTSARPEIVTVTLESSPGHRLAQPTTTWFVNGDPRSCSETALLQAHQLADSKEAFEALVQRHRETVLQSCYRVLGNWHDAEDVSQMVFLVLAQRRVRLSTTLTAWLRTVARHAAIVFWRARTRRAKHERQAARPERLDGRDDDLREELEAALAQLPAPLREAVRLRYLESFSQREAAELLGCPRGTLSQRASLGLRYLRQLFGRSTPKLHSDSDSRFL